MQNHKLFIVVLLFLLAACSQPNNEIKQPTTAIPSTATSLPSLTPIPTLTLTSTKSPYPTSTDTATLTPALIPSDTPTPSPTPWYNLCPIDMTLPDVSFFAPYSSSHLGIDIAAPIGTPLRSPGNCTVTDMYIDSYGGHAVHMTCLGFPGMLELGHIDFQLGDTFEFYKDLEDSYFPDGEPVRDSCDYYADKHFYPGDPLHLYTASTGNSGLPHLHVTYWKRGPSLTWDAHNDPEDILVCRQ